MVTTKLKLSMTEPQVRQIYAKQGDTGRVLDITLGQTPEDGTLRILRPDGVEVTSEAVTGGEVESGETFEALTEADVTELTVGIEPVQDLNGYGKPWVGGAGKNKLNMDALQIGEAWNGDSNTARAVVYSICQPSTQYTLSFSGSDVFEQVIFVEKTSEGATSSNRLVTVTSPFTFTTNATSGVFGLQFNKTAIASSDFANFKAQIETGSTATAWQPYSNICPITGHDEVRVYFGAEQGTADETYTTSLGQTVYGGTLDMVSGVLIVDMKKINLFGSNVTVQRALTQTSGKYRFQVTGNEIVGLKEPPTTGGVTSAISNAYKAISADGSYHCVDGIAVRYATLITIYDSTHDTLSATDAKAYLESIGAYIVAPLATPVQYQLTPVQVKTLVGTNNVWASSGQIVNIKFTYGGLLSELPSDATSIVGKCYCDVEQNGVSSMPFTLNVKKNERQ